MGQAKQRGTKEQRQANATANKPNAEVIRGTFQHVKDTFAAAGWTAGYNAPYAMDQVALKLVKEMIEGYRIKSPNCTKDALYDGLYRGLTLFIPIAKTKYENGVLDMMFGAIQLAFARVEYKTVIAA